MGPPRRFRGGGHGRLHPVPIHPNRGRHLRGAGPGTVLTSPPPQRGNRRIRMHLRRARSLSYTLRRPAWVLALLSLIGGVLFVAVPPAAAYASDYSTSTLPDWAMGPFTRQPQPNPAPVLSPQAGGF